MNNFTLYRLAKLICTSAAFLSLAVAGVAAGQTPEQFTVDHTMKFATGTDKERTQWRKIPTAREIVEGDFAFAKEDLDGDGRPELILLARSPYLCRDGGCALLVLHKTAKGIEPLFVQKVSGKLALTKELVDGYRALAVLDKSGQIAVGNRRNSSLFGKQVVYTMRPRAQTLIGSDTAETAPGKVTASVSAESDSIDLIEFIKQFTTAKGDPVNMGDWKFGARKGSPIRWSTNGIEAAPEAMQKAGYYYQRVGEVVLTLDGKPTHELLEATVVPGKWTIILSGPRAGFTRVALSSGSPGEFGGGKLEGLNKQLPSRHYRCKPQSASSGNNVYQVQVPGKKPIWINDEWSCGSAGCFLTLDIVFTKKEADKFQCF
jgi:hypothetical protein